MQESTKNFMVNYKGEFLKNSFMEALARSNFMKIIFNNELKYIHANLVNFTLV